MRDVAIVSIAQSKNVPAFVGNEIELLLPVVTEAVLNSGLTRSEIGFSTLASSDFYAGQAFAFVRALDAMGSYPVVDDSHVDMDGAFALYEAWLRLQVGDVDSALVVALGRASTGRLSEITPLSLDPYYMAPLCPDPHSLAALQAQAVIARGLCTEEGLYEISEQNLARAARNPFALASEEPSADLVARPLRARDCARVADGAVAFVLAAGERTRSICKTPVWIRAIDQRIEPHALGTRDLAALPSLALAAERVRALGSKVDLAELMCLYPHEQVLLSATLGLGASTHVNASGSGFAGHPVMATGLVTIAHAARALLRGEGRRALAHAASGACLQHNLLTALEVEHG